MKKFIKNNWALLVLGIINLCFSFFMSLTEVVILNAFTVGVCLTAFTLGCIYTYCEEKYGKN